MVKWTGDLFSVISTCFFTQRLAAERVCLVHTSTSPTFRAAQAAGSWNPGRVGEGVTPFLLRDLL